MEGEAQASTSDTRHAGPSIQVPPGMSKNAAKKLARKQKQEATKHERRALERQKKKQNKRARFLAAQQGSHTGSDDDALQTCQSKRHKSAAAAGEGDANHKEFFDARLVIDCGFDELMAENESSSMTQQLMYLYSANRNAKSPFGELILTGQDSPADCLKDVDPEHLSLVPKLAAPADSEDPPSATTPSDTKVANVENNRIGQAMDGKLRGVWRRWKRVTIYKHGGIESLLSSPSEDAAAATASSAAISQPVINGRHFPPEETRQALHRIPISDAIYLTADTDDTLTALEPGKTYIIGGIVDKNRYKGLCRAKADRLGIRAAKLPLSQEMLEAVERNVSSQGDSIRDDAGQNGQDDKGFVGRKVLTVNQVVEILTAWTETRDWVTALEKALPRRKLKQRGPAAKTRGTQTPVETEEQEDDDAARNSA
ncbi:likely tRNA guanine methyltransferase [Pseudozyma hubeiensis SY62]|uniref:tRNA (guanine(9)-N1)-methyltransferase n=1 Tax=Pseudozyma hubeiensis (strain SY62) TaxID=1305764 RepID=R9P3N4_PSEHS|nr:likely tRNA guanine methyltransferase [Pseudozyma hubeiensis SY62]GAC95971.1 likely tRNA guanine methyltransferase [Pseudozyma hubeiensis SY62]